MSGRFNFEIFICLIFFWCLEVKKLKSRSHQIDIKWITTLIALSGGDAQFIFHVSSSLSNIPTRQTSLLSIIECIFDPESKTLKYPDKTESYK
jgi:hypothetical protein